MAKCACCAGAVCLCDGSTCSPLSLCWRTKQSDSYVPRSHQQWSTSWLAPRVKGRSASSRRADACPRHCRRRRCARAAFFAARGSGSTQQQRSQNRAALSSRGDTHSRERMFFLHNIEVFGRWGGVCPGLNAAVIVKESGVRTRRPHVQKKRQNTKWGGGSAKSVRKPNVNDGACLQRQHHHSSTP